MIDRRWFAIAAVALLLVAAVPVATIGIGRGDADTYRSVVVFRNDDLQPRHRAETRRAVTRIFVEEEVPVTLSVIPRADGENVSADGQFCRHLRDLKTHHPGLFEVALHGWNHRQETDFYGASEFGGVPYERQRAWMAGGRAVLANCTGAAPRTFVPPFNTYDDNTTRVAGETGIRAVSGGGWFTASRHNLSRPFRTGRVHHVPGTSEFVGNWTTLEHRSTAALKAHFDRSYAAGAVHVQVLHYQTFDEGARREQLRELIRYMKDRDVVFLTIGEFEEARREGRLRRTDDGWRYRPEPESDEALRWGTGA